MLIEFIANLCEVPHKVVGVMGDKIKTCSKTLFFYIFFYNFIHMVKHYYNTIHDDLQLGVLRIVIVNPKRWTTIKATNLACKICCHNLICTVTMKLS